MEKKGYLISILFIVLLSISIVNARITLSEVDDLYNLGDKVDLKMSILPQTVDGKFEINLLCGGDQINLERMTGESRFVVGNEVSYSTSIKLIPDYISTLKGNCFFQASLAGDSSSTNTFTISNRLITSASFNKRSYNPGEEATITMEIKKDNGEVLDGFFKASGILNIEKPFYSGKLIEKIAISPTTAAGDYEIKLLVYDSLNGVQLNKDESSAFLTINSVPTTLNLAISAESIEPGENISISPLLLDQTEKNSNEIVLLTLISPNNNELTKEIKSGESTQFEIANNAIAGTWKIKAESSELYNEREFLVQNLGKIQTEILNNVVIVKNIGNSVYDGELKINIGDSVQTIKISSLKAGEQKRYSLEAPNGEYSVLISDGEQTQETRLLLTGAAIGIKEVVGMGIFSRYPFVWVFIVIILLLLAGIFLIRLKKTPFKLIGYLKERRGNKLYQQFKTVQLSEDFSMKAKNKVSEAEHTLVLKGEKQSSSVISIKINNLNSLTNNTRQDILKIIQLAETKKGVIEKSGESFIVIFNPLVTRGFSNEGDASDIAFKIYKLFLELNKKISDKFDFGIGLNNGDLIATIDGDKLKYTSLGNTVLLAKKMADLKQSKVYVSEDFRKKIMRDLRVEKADQIGSIPIYSILNVTNRTENSLKLDDLLKRIHE